MTACINWHSEVRSKEYVSVQIAIIDGWKINSNEALKVDLYGCELLGEIDYFSDGVEIVYRHMC